MATYGVQGQAHSQATGTKACVSAATGLQDSARIPPGVIQSLGVRAFPREG